MRKFYLLVIIFLISLNSKTLAYKYAVVVSQSTFSDTGWSKVVDTLVIRHNAKVFTWQSNVWDVFDSLKAYMPDYIAFVAKPKFEANTTLIDDAYEMTRQLDEDPYGDAIWSVVTGLYPEDVLRAITVDSLIIKTILGGFIGYTNWAYQGIGTSEFQHHRITYIFPNGEILDTIDSILCPTDRTVMLVNYLNNGINDSIPGYPRIEGPVDMFMTSGHANVNLWQLHYPDPDEEGYFRSGVYYAGELLGDPYSGPDTHIISMNPKVYYAPGNCLIGNPNHFDNMVYAWFHSGGAIQMIGYTVVTWYGYMGWGVGWYFFKSQGDYTLQEAFFANNQSLIYDLLNHTPGTDSAGLAYDKNAVAIYGDPAQIVKIYPIKNPLFSQNLEIHEGTERDTFVCTITINYDSVALTRHPIIFLPWRIDSIQIDTTNAYDVLITDNFVLLHCWHSGMPLLNAGEQKFVKFTAKKLTHGTKEKPTIFAQNVKLSLKNKIVKNNLTLKISLPQKTNIEISLFSISGRKIASLYKGEIKEKSLKINIPQNIKNGIYFVVLKANKLKKSEKILIIK